MSLLRKKRDSNEREELVSQSEILEAQKKTNREYHKKYREKYLENWKEITSEVSKLKGLDLLSYIEKADQSGVRNGSCTMKINGAELAIIKLAQELMNSKSSRALFINYCKDVIKSSKDD